jgi:hypothetical protein
MFGTRVLSFRMFLVTASIVGIFLSPGVGEAANRGELCDQLSRQIDTVVLQNPKSSHVAAARVLQQKADRLCATQKPAQGIRAHADALKLLGVKPVVDNQ